MFYFRFIIIAMLCRSFVLGQGSEGVQLVGGLNQFKGRVEVSYNGHWATVCDKNFDKTDARFICRSLGIENVETIQVFKDLRYGQGTGPVITDLGCTGDESNLHQCLQGQWDVSTCKHSEDVALDCQTPVYVVGSPYSNTGEVKVTVSGANYSVCSDVFGPRVAEVTCRMLGFSTGNTRTQAYASTQSKAVANITCTGQEADISDCGSKPLTVSGCSNVTYLECRTALRLVNGPTTQSGRVEIFFNDEWGTVCDDSFDDEDAAVICRTLGLNPLNALSYGSAYFGHGNGSIIIDELECNGKEVDVSQCRSNPWLSHTNCDHAEDAGVECLTEVRLTDGPTRTSGRVEVKQGSAWFTFCDEDFTNNTATVICNMLGHRQGNVTVHKKAYYGPATVKSLDYIPMCHGNETDVVQCWKEEKETTCSSNNTTGINCYSVTPVRLAGGWKSLVGKVELFSIYDRSWLSLCHSSFTLADAQVVCRMLGNPQSNPTIVRAHGFYNFVIRDEGLHNLNCVGKESDISDCLSPNVWKDSTCTYTDFVGVNCEPVTPIRLVDGPSIRAGRVELMYNNTWGRVCGRNFGLQDRDVLCRTLGHNNGSLALSSSYFATGTGPYTVSNLACVGTESDVSNCESDAWLSTSSCSYSTIGIACKTPVRLVNGSYERSGRVEVYHNGTWGSICADAIDLKVAHVICRVMGFTVWNATVLAGSEFGDGSLNLLDNLTCSGNEADISMCRGGPWAAVNCSQGAAAVDCKTLVTPMRLVNTGITPYSGEVQVFYNNKWGTISYSGITKKTVDVLCLTLGYNFSRDASWTSSSYNCYTHMINGLACHGNESDVSECPSNVWDTQTCYYGYRLNINCLTRIYLEYGRTKTMGRVRLVHNSSSGSICADDFTEENGHVICSMLGYSYTRNVQAKKNIFNYTTYNNVIIDGLNCTGDEKDISLCPSNIWTFNSNCSNTNAVGINCNTPVRLTDSQTPRVGKVQVKVNGTWARVCLGTSSSESVYVGQVVCRELGYSTSKVRTYEAVAGTDGTTYSIVCNGGEADLSLCRIETTSCTNVTVLGVACVTPLSLLYGRTKYMGYVRLSVSATGGISPSGLNDDDANHVCRLLGHNFTSFAMLQQTSDLRSPSYIQIVVNNLQCKGNETDIADCIPNFENWPTRSYSYSNNMMVNCQTPLRVVNGQPYIYGELQIFSNNTWMSVCANEFTTEDAYVVCRMMGHSHVRNTTIYRVPSKAGTENCLKGDFQCNGDEDDLSQCENASLDRNQCDHRVKIDCRTSARIVDGPTPYEGQIELFVNETWLPVCSRTYVSTNEARILCRTAGFIETSPYVSYVPSNVNDTLFIDTLRCVGTEETISECSSTKWITDSSSSSSVVKLACYTPVRISSNTGSNKHNGQLLLNPLGTWRHICANSFSEADLHLTCKRLGYDTNSTSPILSTRTTVSTYNSFEALQCVGNESDVQGCNHSNWKINPSSCQVTLINCQPVTPVRLVGGVNNSSGRVEVFYDGQWGVVCRNYFDETDASVFCSMLGYRSGIMSSRISPTSSYIVIENLQCRGTETDVSECPSMYWRHRYFSCSYSGNAYIECSDLRVRLSNGHNIYRGQVEIQYNGYWNTLCLDFTDLNDTEVICRELGVTNQTNATIYQTGVIPSSNAGSRRIQDLMCDGSEDIIDECQSFPWISTSHSCSQRSVAINCRPRTPIRLAGGLNKYSGRVEVEYPVGRWGTLCDYDFDEKDAQVICRSLGLNDKSVGVKLRSYYGYQSLSASISHLYCSSYESDISECNVGYNWGSSYAYCDSTRQAGVQCNTPLRLSGGRTKYSGLLEVYYQRAWGTVCGEGFDLLDAQTVCNILGLRDQYNGSIVVNEGTKFGQSTGNVVLNNLDCKGDESDLHECGTLHWMNNSCSHDRDVAINCRATTELRLMNGDIEMTFDPNKAGQVEGRVEVFYDGQWGTICNDHFDDDDAFVLCSMKGYIAGLYRYNTDEYGPGKGPITVDDLYCAGDEQDVSECWSREWNVHDCGHDEDVAIECYFEENPDPCNKFNQRPLPYLESRYVHFKTEGQDTAYNDSRLVTRWYNVGKEVMPNFAPKVHSCGTTYPVYLTGAIPQVENEQVDRMACQVTNNSNCGHMYNISIKLCPDHSYVYRLRPTVDEHSGYCFGIGTEGQAPDYVASKVTVATRQKTHNFVCDFTESEDDLFYSVNWEIQGDRDISLTKGYCNRSNMTLLDLTEEDLVNRTVKMGFRLVCSVRSYMVPGGPPGRLSHPSSAFFAGIQIITPSINMRRGETKAIEFRLTVPLSCDISECTLDLMSFTPDYGNCQSNSLSFSSGSCGMRIRQKDETSVQQLNITSAETGQYGVAGSFQVFLQTTAYSKLSPLWKDLKLPAIEVKILPEADRKWRGKLCAARNDPHMYTFDGRQYEHHVKGNDHQHDTKGTFVLYKNIKYGNDVEIQHRVTPCTTPDNPAMCNCGVAVRAGRDVYVISVCDSLIDIGYKHCGDNSLTVKKEDDTTYTVYLPYGTAVRARIDIQPWMGPEGGMALDISVNPSVYDQEGNSRGLCGTLDGDPDNDFHYTDINGNATSIQEGIDFINKWRVNETESMFSKHLETMDFNPWLFPVCVCNNDRSSKDILPCKSSIQTCTPGVSTGTHSCYDVSSRRSVRSLNRRPTIPAVPIPTHFIAKQRTKRAVVPTGPWTEDLAADYCNQVFSESSAFLLCQKVPFTHTNLSLDNCVLDILLTNSTEWLALTLQSMQDSCILTVMKNTTVRQEIAENVTADGGGADLADPIQVVINSIIEEFAVTCKFDCNDNGICNNGTCECYEGFGGSDCSVNTTGPPGLVGVLDNGLCDEANSTCDVIYGFGGIFLSQRLTCRLRKGMIDIDGNEQLITTIVTEGQAETLVEVMCPVPIDTQYVDDPPISTTTPNFIVSSFVIFYDVSVSNTGEYSDEQRVYVYDSTCQTYMIDSSNNYTFSVKAGSCRIERSCYISGETNPLDVTLLCDPQQSDHQWTFRNESSTQPTTSTSTSTQPTTSTSTTIEPTTSTSTTTEPTTSTSTSTQPTTSASTTTEPTASTSTSTQPTTSTSTTTEPTTSTSTTTEPTTSTSKTTEPTTSTSTPTEPTTSTSTPTEATTSTSTSTQPTTSTSTTTEPTTSTSTPTEATTSTSTSTEPITSTSASTEPTTSTSTSTEPTTSTSASTEPTNPTSTSTEPTTSTSTSTEPTTSTSTSIEPTTSTSTSTEPTTSTSTPTEPTTSTSTPTEPTTSTSTPTEATTSTSTSTQTNPSTSTTTEPTTSTNTPTEPTASTSTSTEPTTSTSTSTEPTTSTSTSTEPITSTSASTEPTNPTSTSTEPTTSTSTSTEPTTPTSTSIEPTTLTSTSTEPTTSTSTPTEPTTSTSTSTEPTTSTSTPTEPTTPTSTSIEPTTSTSTSTEPTTSTSTSIEPTTSTSTSTEPTTSTSTPTEPTTSTSTSTKPTTSTSTSTEPTTSTSTSIEPTTSTSTLTEPTTSTSTSIEPTTSTSTSTEPTTSTSTSTKPTTSTSTVPTFDPAVTRRSDLVLILIFNVTADLNDENVQMDYRNKAHKAIKTRYETWFSEGSLKHIIVTGVRKGSLIVDHTLFTEKTSVTDSQLIKLMHEGISTINFSGVDIEVEKLEPGLNEDSNNLLCEIHANINTCECELVNGNPTCVIGHDRTSIPVVVTWVSAVSGVVVILAILIAVVVVCRHKYLKLKRKSETMSTNSADNTWTPNWIWTTIPKRGHYSIGSPESAPYNQTSIDGCRLPRLKRQWR